MLLLSFADFFKINFKKKIMNTIRVSKGLDPDQDRHSESKLFEKVISRRQKSLARKELLHTHVRLLISMMQSAS